MDLPKERDLDRLVSAMYDDGVSEQELRRLEALLADDPALQERYWQLVSTHIALGVAMSGSRDGNSPIADRLAPLDHSRKAHTLLGNALIKLNSKWAAGLAVAATLLIANLLAWNHFFDRANHGVPREDVANEAPPQPQHWTVDRMPTVTYVSWDGPSFSEDADQWQPIAKPDAGSISLRLKEGQLADGYLFCLEPGASVELVATFDATGENGLSVAEITANDRRPLRKATFSNCGIGPKPLHANPGATNRRYGVLGRWSEQNATASPRYFLLTGSHKLAAPAPSDDWQLSDMEVLLAQENVIHIGWDDSGPAPAPGEAYQHHDDYDDLAATLFITTPNSSSPPTDALQVMGVRDKQFEQLPAGLRTEGAYRATLAPGESILLKVAADASAPNAIFVVDPTTNAVVWATSNKTRSMNLGAAAVRNQSSSPCDVLIISGHQTSDQSWSQSDRKTLYEQAGFVILGYDDARHDGDFNDLRVSVLEGNHASAPAKSNQHSSSL